MPDHLLHVTQQFEDPSNRALRDRDEETVRGRRDERVGDSAKTGCQERDL